MQTIGWSRLAISAALSLGLMGCDDETSAQADAMVTALGDASTGGTDAEPDAAVPGPCGTTTAELIECADVERLGATLDFVAQPRVPGSPHWQAVQDRCATSFEAAGFTVERHAYGTGVNVIGVLPGLERPDERVLLSAHYDHIAECAGADDNGSGTAALIEAAHVLGQARYARTIVLACWDEEEFGLLGSRAYATRAKAAGDDIHAHLVFEMIGYKRDEPQTQYLPNGFDLLFPQATAMVEAGDWAGDFIAAITNEGQASANETFVEAAASLNIKVVPVVLAQNLLLDASLGDLRRSDHAGFWENGYPGMQLTDTANFRNPHYHCSRGQDDIASVDMDWMFRIMQASIMTVASEAEMLPGTGSGAALVPPENSGEAVAECDPLAQDCADGQRCSLLYDGRWLERCVAPSAAGVAAGEACVRAETLGEDDCANGLLCALWGLPESEPQLRTCRTICRSNVDCPADEDCVHLGGTPRTGACATRCDPVQNNCPEGTHCSVSSNADRAQAATYCTFAGDVADREACRTSSDCATGQCVRPSGISQATCAPFCLADADCIDGERCNLILPQQGRTPGTGRCQPELQ